MITQLEPEVFWKELAMSQKDRTVPFTMGNYGYIVRRNRWYSEQPSKQDIGARVIFDLLVTIAHPDGRYTYGKLCFEPLSNEWLTYVWDAVADSPKEQLTSFKPVYPTVRTFQKALNVVFTNAKWARQNGL